MISKTHSGEKMSATIAISCVDTAFYTETYKALATTLDTLQNQNIVKIYWFSDVPFDYNLQIPVQWVPIPKITKDYVERSFPMIYNMVALKFMPMIVGEDYNLIIQDDGFAVNADAWTDEFLQYDYIGACWGEDVGNGGFSLRSKKLYRALHNLNVIYNWREFPKELYRPEFEGHVWLNTTHADEPIIPEDNIICRIYKQDLVTLYGIKFAPAALADRFSIENKLQSPWLGRSLGFHGRNGAAKYYNVELKR